MVLFCLHSYLSVHLCIDSVPNEKLVSKFFAFIFLTFFLPKCWPVCSFESSYDPFMPYKVYLLVSVCLHNYVFGPFRSYSVPNGQLASKLTILYFGPSFCSNFGSFCSFQSSCDISIPCKVHSCIFCLHDHFYIPVIDLQRYKWKIDLKIDDFIYSIFIPRGARRKNVRGIRMFSGQEKLDLSYFRGTNRSQVGFWYTLGVSILAKYDVK